MTTTASDSAPYARQLDIIREDTAAIEQRTANRDRTIGTAYRDGATLDEIARAAGCARETVRTALHRQGVEVRARGVKR